MTPKEKAEQLVDKFYQTTPNEGWFNPPISSIQQEYKAWEQSRQCALIAVYEIIETLDSDIKDIDVRGNVLLDLIDYWREVKNELKNL